MNEELEFVNIEPDTQLTSAYTIMQIMEETGLKGPLDITEVITLFKFFRTNRIEVRFEERS